jgi:hypothetical protein
MLGSTTSAVSGDSGPNSFKTIPDGMVSDRLSSATASEGMLLENVSVRRPRLSAQRTGIGDALVSSMVFVWGVEFGEWLL